MTLKCQFYIMRFWLDFFIPDTNSVALGKIRVIHLTLCNSKMRENIFKNDNNASLCLWNENAHPTDLFSFTFVE